jgi:hypothetical protein
MSKIIIGIHGLANKPPEKELKDWWQKSIAEGLRVNCGIQNPEFNFKIVYWADLLYRHPLHREDGFTFDALYNHEPYEPAEKGALKEYKDSMKDDFIAAALGLVGTTVDTLKERFGVNSFADWLLGKLLKDLAFYYDDNRMIKGRNDQYATAKNVLRDELRNALLPEKEKEIMLIAHSMGSIIAYDVLRNLGRENAGVVISHFVTIGSPLGLPHVKGKIIQEREYDPRVRTPSIVTKRWVNYADRKDPVAVDVHLRDDYEENDKTVRVKADLILNDYCKPTRDKDKEHNHHKSYGYLRTPELSEHIKDFLEI